MSDPREAPPAGDDPQGGDGRHATTAWAREVSPLELFYDLVFVFAVSQLSEHLLHDLTWQGAAETLVLLCAVFTVWLLTTFEATYFDITRRHTQAAVLTAMALGLFMNAAIGIAFTVHGGWAFVVPLVGTQIARGIVTATTAPTPLLRQHYRRALTWLLASAPFWIVGAAIAPGTRLWWWGAATAIDVTGVWLAHPWPHQRLQTRHIAFDYAHMAERLRLFLLIALGEVVLTSATAIAEAPTEPVTILAGVAAFVLVAALWAFYFAGSPVVVDRQETPTTDPIWTARMGANGQYVVLAGLVTTAVGCQAVITHPRGAESLTIGLLLGGGPLLYVATQTWYLRLTTRTRLTTRWIACLVLAAAIPLAAALPPLATLGLVAVTLAALSLIAPRHRYVR
ncbi:low temperature requirement protein A [Micromonospora globispora]|uniref:Low temperature requirement protein A n=1 Tax=Micromonospora globispora TaxID=1450148 RepID=A0A317K3C6_9ACTN|nr:low temperature requirement protein A [Micromonospora globispora]PWU47371.1 low temperature requirement protein A [Micromonospora globispora]PWU61380.1 low temperature requirement protein A [Micromonospora globispora]RQX00565.1 low temperature requirement protein A [Micromonospora globispora]